MLGGPANGNVELHYSYDYRAVYHVDGQGDQLESEGCLGASRARYGEEEYLSADGEEI